MALFETQGPFSHEVIREGDDVIISINLEEYPHVPSLEDDSIVMSKTFDLLMEIKDATKIVFIQKRNYEYEFNQTILLREIARLYLQFTKRKDIFG